MQNQWVNTAKLNNFQKKSIAIKIKAMYSAHSFCYALCMVIRKFLEEEDADGGQK